MIHHVLNLVPPWPKLVRLGGNSADETCWHTAEAGDAGCGTSGQGYSLSLEEADLAMFAAFAEACLVKGVTLHVLSRGWKPVISHFLRSAGLGHVQVRERQRPTRP